MNLRHLKIQRMPGIEEPFELPEFVDGINLILGPNGSGKTTLCKAIEWVLWPEKLKTDRAEVDARFDIAGTSHQARLRGRTVQWQADGRDATAPPLPEQHLAPCYRMTVEDLLRADGTDQGLAERVAREMAGGYDVDAVRKELCKVPSHLRNLSGDLKKAAKALREEQQAQQAIEHRMDQLESYRRKRDELGASITQRDALNRARELHEARIKLEHTEQIAARFPEGMDRLHGNEGDELAEIDRAVREAAQKLGDAERTRDQQQAHLDATGLRDHTVSPQRLDEAKEQADRLYRLQDSLSQSRTSLAEAEANLHEARARLAGSPTDSDKPSPPPTNGTDADSPRTAPSDLDDLADFVESSARVRRERELIALQLQTLAQPTTGDPDTDAPDADSLREAASALRTWLRTPSPEASPNAHRGPDRASLLAALAGVLGVVGIVLSILLAALVHSAWSLVGVLAILLLVAVVIVSLRQKGGASTDPGARTETLESAQRRFLSAGVGSPPDWTPDAVSQRLTAIERQLAETVQRHEARQHADREAARLRVELESLDQQAADLETERTALRSRVGIEAGHDLTLATIARRLADLDQAEAAVRAVEGRVQSQQEERDQLAAKIRSFLKTVPDADTPDDETADADALKAALAAVSRRVEGATNARREIELATRDMQTHQTTLKDLAARRSSLFERAGLDDEDETVLKQRLDQLADFREARKALGDAASNVSYLTSALEELPGGEDCAGLDRETLDQRIEAVEKAAKERDKLVQTIAEIETEARSTSSGTKLEDLLAAQETAKRSLEDKREEVLEAVAAGFLLDRTRAEHSDRSMPEVLRRAGDWFRVFTQHRYDLRLDPGGAGSKGEPTFRAVETATGLGKGLGELSSGTRSQLLLAARLAFAVMSERGERLPIFLDEALSHSDPERFGAVAGALADVVLQEGRQVVYLTCQPADAEAWRRVLDDKKQENGHAGVAMRQIDLGELRGRPAMRTEALDWPEPRTVPPPDGPDAAAYAARVGVPAFDARRAPIESMHILPLLGDDLDLVHRLLRAGIERLGPLTSLAERGDSGLLHGETRRRVLERIDAARVCHEAWLVGRGRPLTREVLIDAGVTDAFLERVVEVAGEVDWDGATLLDRLRDGAVPRFRTNTIEEMDERFREEGYIDEAERLSREEIRVRVVQRVGEEGAESPEALGHLADRLLAVFQASDGCAAAAMDGAGEPGSALPFGHEQ